eukprot:m.33085 g.33085  ORF g.33085 m.33085 type:complete len:628 (+) comp6430_c0_seq2:130-2013(+)
MMRAIVVLVVVAVVLVVCNSVYGELPRALVCENATDATLKVVWNGGDESDAFYVAIGERGVNEGRPYYAIPTSNTTIVVPDLQPSTSYLVQLFYHKRALSSFVWGWERSAETITCTTKTLALTALPPISIQRRNQAHPSTLLIAVSLGRNSNNSHNSVDVEVYHDSSYGVLLGSRDDWDTTLYFNLYHACMGEGKAYLACKEWTHHALNTENGVFKASPQPQPQPNPAAVTDGSGGKRYYFFDFHGLVPESTYLIVWLGGNEREVVQGMELMNTAASQAATSATNGAADGMVGSGSFRYDNVYRISEYTFDLDFLENHNSADIEAMGPYLMHGTPVTTSSVWPNSTAEMWNHCQETMMEKCGSYRGQAFDCLTCAYIHSNEIIPVCGNFSFHDNPNEGFNIHFFCGTGWPESVIMNSTIAQYCVESEPFYGLNSTTGYAQYVSCNSDETDYFGNKAIDPICQCWVADDRILSQQTFSQMHATCSFNDLEPFVNEVKCFCGNNGVLITPDNPSNRYVGRSPIYLPYGYWLDKPIPEHYNVSYQCGNNLSTPRMGSCGLTKSVTDPTCTWKMLPIIRMMYGSDLLANGYNTAQVNDTPSNFTLSLHNMDAFKKTVTSVESRLKPRCCGC